MFDWLSRKLCRRLAERVDELEIALGSIQGELASMRQVYKAVLEITGAAISTRVLETSRMKHPKIDEILDKYLNIEQ
jgi:hypothetical protein